MTTIVRLFHYALAAQQIAGVVTIASFPTVAA
jgi:hypothetical protein